MPDEAPTGPISRDLAEHYVWGDGCDGWHLVRATGLSVIEERMPPGTAETRHRHARARQFFYVLAGTVTMEVAGALHVLEPGQGIEVPPGTPHEVFNLSAANAEFLVVSEPPTRGDREPVPTGQG